MIISHLVMWKLQSIEASYRQETDAWNLDFGDLVRGRHESRLYYILDGICKMIAYGAVVRIDLSKNASSVAY